LPPALPLDPAELAEGDWVEDYLAISRVKPGRIWLEENVGPIDVPQAASELAQPGWSLSVAAARRGGRWHLLELGAVYP
jgi:hypothetical protein